MSYSGAGRWVGRLGLVGRLVGKELGEDGVEQGWDGMELERVGRIQGKVKEHRELVVGRKGSQGMLVTGSHELGR